MSSAITFDNVTLGYERHPAIHHLSGTVDAGDLLAVIGPNGAGKSTLLKGLAGLLRPLEGRIAMAGGRRDIAYLPQRSQVDRAFPLSLFDFVAMGRALLAEPDLLARIEADGSVRAICNHCNECMPTIYSHTHCTLTGAPDR